jgi:PTS system glucose-specific IIA component
VFGLLFKKKERIVEFKSPIVGEVVALADVPDQVFAGKMVGDGIAFKPDEGVLFAPVSGRIVQVFPTKHAIGLETKEGLDVLIHIGINTVEMKGEGFRSFVSKNQWVEAGDKIMEFDLDLIEKYGKSTVTPVIITNMGDVKSIEFYDGKVTPQATVMKVRI